MFYLFLGRSANWVCKTDGDPPIRYLQIAAPPTTRKRIVGLWSSQPIRRWIVIASASLSQITMSFCINVVNDAVSVVTIVRINTC